MGKKTLTVSQFVIAQFFVIATFMVSKQINYSLNENLGFNKDGIITFELPRDTISGHRQQLLNNINAIPEVEVASTGFLSPADAGAAFTNIGYAAKPEVKEPVQIRWGDPNYLNVYKLNLLAGRNVGPSDSIKEFIINDKYARLLGFQHPEDAIGKLLNFNDKQMPVVGVIQDFHDQSMRAPISAMVLAGNNGNIFHIRLKPNLPGSNNWQHAIAKIRRAYKSIYPEADFDYHFFDETIAAMYTTEQHTAQLLGWATGLAVVISCLGLLGLVMFTIHTRTKEIGIRKVLGATVASIVSILSKDFVKLVLIAFMIAAPVAWWAIHQWLQNFAYRTAMSWWVFVVSGCAMILIAVLTLSIQTIRAATSSPVKNLKTE